jgi:hypothetical protein
MNQDYKKVKDIKKINEIFTVMLNCLEKAQKKS